MMDFLTSEMEKDIRRLIIPALPDDSEFRKDTQFC